VAVVAAAAAGILKCVSLTREPHHLGHGKGGMHSQIQDHPQRLDLDWLLSTNIKNRKRGFHQQEVAYITLQINPTKLLTKPASLPPPFQVAPDSKLTRTY
jgi:hypothetical protein